MPRPRYSPATRSDLSSRCRVHITRGPQERRLHCLIVAFAGGPAVWEIARHEDREHAGDPCLVTPAFAHVPLVVPSPREVAHFGTQPRTRARHAASNSSRSGW